MAKTISAPLVLLSPLPNSHLVYALWKCPFILPVITIHPGVFKYIASGAGFFSLHFPILISPDLMLPGVVLPENIDINQYFKKEERYSIVLQGTVYVAISYLSLIYK